MTMHRTSTTAARLIATILTLAGDSAELVSAHEREWVSATFHGARHRVELRLSFDRGDAPMPSALLSLPEHEFVLSREIVADCTVAFGAREKAIDGGVIQTIEIELLTIAAD